MRSRFLPMIVFVLAFLQPAIASALTMEQVSRICDSASENCSDHPVLQAYVGGALDLLATLDEDTRYLDKLYCKDPKEIFDVPTIIRFMQSHDDEYATRNAMLLVVRYFEGNGGCQPDE